MHTADELCAQVRGAEAGGQEDPMDDHRFAIPSQHQLDLIVAVAKIGRITSAAEALRISQPALTTQIQAAERLLGVKLFERGRGGVELTAAGHIVLRFAHRREAQGRAMFAELARLTMGDAGTIVIGASTVPAEFYLPNWLKKFGNAYPKVDVRLSFGTSLETISRLEDGLIDMAVVGLARSIDAITSKTIAQYEIILFAPYGVFPSRPTKNDLRHTRFVMPRANTATAMLAMEAFHRIGMTPDKIFEAPTNEAAIRLVEGGMGVGVLSERAVERGEAAGRLQRLSLRGWRCKNDICLMRPEGIDNVLVDHFSRFCTE